MEPGAKEFWGCDSGNAQVIVGYAWPSSSYISILAEPLPWLRTWALGLLRCGQTEQRADLETLVSLMSAWAGPTVSLGRGATNLPLKPISSAPGSFT